MESSQADSLMTIPKRFLLSVYLVLPALAAFFLWDMLLNNSGFLPYMGLNSMVLPLYLLFFELPHIIASFFGFVDKEYVRHYKKHLFVYLPLILAGTGVLMWWNFELGVTLYLVGTVWHGLKQQTGIALILGARPGWHHTLWTVVPVVITSLAYVYYIVPDIYPNVLIPLINPIVLFGIVSLMFITAWKMWVSKPEVRLYIVCVSCLFFFSYLFILTGYIFLAFFAVRFIHDVSAFAFYITHDRNRNRGERKNLIYRVLEVVPLPIVILTPVLAVGFAFLARTTADGIAIGYVVLVLMGMSHYYLESVMWKRDNLHRQQIKVV